jgi:hypothetical protein
MKSEKDIHIQIRLDGRSLYAIVVILLVFAGLYLLTGLGGGTAVMPSRVLAASGSSSAEATPAASLAASSAGKRLFYLRSAWVAGNFATTQCNSGFHMASIWEILDVSNLSYDHTNPTAITRADAGVGPPAGSVGWVRTGNASSGTNIAGTGNCNNWTSGSVLYYGTAARLGTSWNTPPGQVALWGFETFECDTGVPTWCVQD